MKTNNIKGLNIVFAALAVLFIVMAILPSRGGAYSETVQDDSDMVVLDICTQEEIIEPIITDAELVADVVDSSEGAMDVAELVKGEGSGAKTAENIEGLNVTPCHAVSGLDDCEPYGMCDADANGVINESDYVHIKKYVIELEPYCGFEGNECYCDINDDDKISGLDALFLGKWFYFGTCGDGLIKVNEECDDGENVSGDGCSDLCVVEEDWECSGEPSVCERKNTGGGGTSGELPICGAWSACVDGFQEKLCEGNNGEFKIEQSCEVEKPKRTITSEEEESEESEEKSSKSESESTVAPLETNEETEQLIQENETGNELTGAVAGSNGWFKIWPFVVLVIIVVGLFIIYAIRAPKKSKNGKRKLKVK